MSVVMQRPTIATVELHTVHLYQHYLLFMHDKPQYTWRGDYCEFVQPGQLPVLTEVRAPPLLEQHPRYVPPPPTGTVQDTTKFSKRQLTHHLR